MVLDMLGLAYAGHGDRDRAVETYNEAIRLASSLRMHRSEADTLVNLAHLLRTTGREHEARQSLERARELLTELGDPALEALGPRRAPPA